MYSKSSLALAAAAIAHSAVATSGDLSRLPTPPMGFNNWSRFKCDLNQTLFTTTADAMVSKGLLAAGYNRINLDDCWLNMEREADNTLSWNTTLFPDGLIYLGKYLKARGFQFGIYEDAGMTTCTGYPGSQGYEALDAQTFLNWGVDYLKLDGCNVALQDGRTSYVDQYSYTYGYWHDVIDNLTTPLVFSESAPAYFVNSADWYTIMDEMPTFGDLARHSYDIATYDSSTKGSHFWFSVLSNYGEQVLLARYARPGYFNDPDYIIADFPMTLDEKRSQFALWSSLAAPLIISSYIPDLTADEINYLTNKDIIAVDQDALGLQATLVSQDGTWDVLTRSLANGDRLLTVLNRGASTGTTTITFDRVGIPAGTYSVKDLWTGKTSKVSSVSISLPSHATAIYRISGATSVTPTGMIFNSYQTNCLTSSADGTNVTFTACNGSNSQVWAVSSKNTISSLAYPKQCLSNLAGGAVVLRPCITSMAGQVWKYDLTGNLQTARGNCLTGGYPHGSAPNTQACDLQGMWYQQIFGLPSGVTVNGA